MCHNPTLEHAHEGFYIVLVGSNRGQVDATAAQRVAHVELALVPPAVKSLTHMLAASVDPTLGAVLGIGYSHQAHIGHRGLTLIIDLNGYHIVLAVGYRQSLVIVVLIYKITYQEGCAPTLEGTGEKLQSAVQVGALALGCEVEQLAQNKQDVLASFLGRNEFFYLVAEENHAHLVVVLDSRKGKSGSNLGHHFPL